VLRIENAEFKIEKWKGVSVFAKASTRQEKGDFGDRIRLIGLIGPLGLMGAGKGLGKLLYGI